ncbi:MAG: hypothetical protein IKK59_06230 [Lachnospiraceae bacterium]|nr:hypothetical protein [Lachnospiraceae bacterium]
MAVMDEFKEERAKMKEQPFKKRLEYFWDYHKYHVLAGAFVLFFVIDMIYNMLTAKDTAFMAILLNSAHDEAKAATYTEALTTAMGINPSKEQLMIDTSIHITGDGTDYESSQVLSVRVGANEMDVMLADADTFGTYVRSELFLDLREVLTEEQIAYYEDNFYYMDYALIESGYYDELAFDANTVFVDTLDHTTPEGMEKPVPVGIYMDTFSEDFSECYHVGGEPPVFGIAGYCEEQRISYSVQYLDYISGRVPLEVEFVATTE